MTQRSRSFSKVVLAGALVVGLSASGCFRHSYTVGSGGNTQATPRYSKWHSHHIYGLIGEDTVDVKSVCPSGNATVKDSQSFVNALIGALIGLFWYPTTVEVYCDEGGAVSDASSAKTLQLTLSPEQLRAIAAEPKVLAAVSALDAQKGEELARALELSRAGTHGLAARSF